MATYLDGQLVIADDLLLVQKLNMLTGGPITTPAAVDLSLVPGAGGITKVGAGSPGHLGTPTNDDFFVAGRMEVDDAAGFDSTLTCYTSLALRDLVRIYFGNGSDASMRWNTVQTPDTLIMLLSAASRSVVICEDGDDTVDFGNTQKADPTLIIQSADATNVTQRVLSYHDRTDGVAETETGDYLIKTPAQKTLKLGTVVWDDLRVPLTRGALGVGNPPTYAQFMDDGAGSVGVNAYAFAYQAVAGNEEQIYFEVQLPHSYKEGTDIKAHLHWSPAVTGGAGEFVKWGLEYTWINIDGTFGNTAIVASDASGAGTATTSGDGTLAADKHYLTQIATITGTSKLIGSMLVCRLFRNSSDGDDTLAQDAFGLEFDFHYQVDTIGSRQELVK